MSFAISLQSEVLKTKRSASFWLSMIAAAMMPILFLLVHYFEPQGALKALEKDPWGTQFMWGWQSRNFFIFPLFVILICSLIPQIEFKNNTWKQVFASPQSLGNIFLSKYVAIVIMVLFLFLLFNVFMILAAVVPNLFLPRYKFLESRIDWQALVTLNFKT